MADTLKCTVCGGDLKFTPQSQTWTCEWCDKVHTEADLKGFTQEADEKLDEAVTETVRRDSEDGFVTYKCGYCGAEVVTTEETSATFCVYCQRPVTIASQISGEFKPSVIIPFKNTKGKAMEQFKRFVSGKRFLPDAYKSNQNIEKLTGVYIPFWFYDGDVYFDMEGEADIITTKRDGEQVIRKTDTFNVARAGQISIKNVPVDASAKTSDDIMDSIEPFDFSGLKKFATPYLSGFLAERYDVSKDAAYERAKKRFEGSAENQIKASLSKYNVVRKKRNEKQIKNLSVQYGLLPVWLLYSKFEGQTYIFAMNGQTDKILGNLPLDTKKVVRYALLMFIICSPLGALVGFVLSMLI